MLANVEKSQIDKHHVMDVGAIKLDVGESIAGTAVTDGAESPHWQLFAPPSLIKLPVKCTQQAKRRAPVAASRPVAPKHKPQPSMWVICFVSLNMAANVALYLQ